MLVIQNEFPDLYAEINEFFEKRLIDGIDGAAKKILENKEIESEIPKKAKGILEKLAAEGKI